jgi:hypothetical protein
MSSRGNNSNKGLNLSLEHPSENCIENFTNVNNNTLDSVENSFNSVNKSFGSENDSNNTTFEAYNTDNNAQLNNQYATIFNHKQQKPYRQH